MSWASLAVTSFPDLQIRHSDPLPPTSHALPLSLCPFSLSVSYKDDGLWTKGYSKTRCSHLESLAAVTSAKTLISNTAPFCNSGWITLWGRHSEEGTVWPGPKG